MAKFYGPIGYAETVETEPGIHEELIVERYSSGDWVRNSGKFKTAPDTVNSDANISNELSIISDPYSANHFLNIRYVGFMGAKWTVNNVEVKYPRLILNIGGVYNGR